MDDVLLFAGDQSPAHIQSQTQDLIFAVLTRHIFFQRRQQLHPDVNIPPDPVLVGRIPDILTGYHIRAAGKLLHEQVFPYKLFHLLFEICRDLFP